MKDQDFGVVVDTFLDELTIVGRACDSSQNALTSCRETATDTCCAGPCGQKQKPKPKAARAAGARTRAAIRRQIERAIRVRTRE